jgi:hypothetical protein
MYTLNLTNLSKAAAATVQRGAKPPAPEEAHFFDQARQSSHECLKGVVCNIHLFRTIEDQLSGLCIHYF